MLKRKKRNINAEITGVIRKKLEAFNYAPVSYKNSSEYNSVSSNRENWASKKLEGIPIDELSDDVLDPTIDAACRLEIAIAHSQYSNHVSTIKDILDSCSSQIDRGENILNILEVDRDKFIEEKERLQKLRGL